MRFRRKNNSYLSPVMIKYALCSVLHRISLALGLLITMYYFLVCVFSINGAFDDMRKYEGLGFSYSFYTYLCNNGFIDNIWKFVLFAFEYVLYILLHHRMSRMQHIRVSVLYFLGMSTIHLIMVLGANYAVLPITPPYITEGGFSLSDGIFLGIAAIQAVIYTAAFVLGVHCSGVWK